MNINDLKKDSELKLSKILINFLEKLKSDIPTYRLKHLDTKHIIDIYLKENKEDLFNIFKEELVKAHSEGIRFIAQDTIVPQPISYEWFKRKYE